MLAKKLKLLKEFAPQIEQISKKEYWLMAGLLLLVFWGMYAFYVQETEGHIVTGMRDHVVWGLYIANFIFFIGIGYTGALISGILQLFRAEWRKPIVRIAELMSVIATVIGPLFILLCMGRLDRLHHLVIYGRIQSPITWDVLAITTYLFASLLFLYLALIKDFALLRDYPQLKVANWRKRLYKFLAIGYNDTTQQKKRLQQAVDIMSAILIPLAIIVSSVLAWIFGLTLRPGWHNTIFGPYFVVGAVYTGTGALVIAMWVFRKAYHLEEHITRKHFNYLGTLLLILGAVYGYLTFADYLTTWYGSMEWDKAVLEKLFDFSHYGWLLMFSIVVGIGLLMVVLGIPMLRTINNIALVSTLMVVAMWVKRYIIIIPTLETPLLPIQDTRHDWVYYSPTWVEIALILAGLAAFLLLFLLASKFVPIVPISEVAEEKPEEQKTARPVVAINSELNQSSIYS